MNGDKTNKIILLVEDEASTSIVQKRALEKSGYTVITADSGEKAIELFDRNKDIGLILMDIDLGDERFDLILCSHVLYYIPEGSWIQTVEKMYHHLSPGGCLIIVMQSPLGEVADFFNNFTTYDVPILDLTRDVITRYGDDAVLLQYFQNEIYSESLDDVVEIGLFLLLDQRFNARKSEIAEYFRIHHNVNSGYLIKQDEILLVIRKLPSHISTAEG